MASYASKLKGGVVNITGRFDKMQSHYLTPEQQTATYTADLPENIKTRVESAVVEKKDPFQLVINYKNKGSLHNYGAFDHLPDKKANIYKLDFKVGVVVFAVDKHDMQLYIVAWHADDVHFSIINLQGEVLMTSKLPAIPDGFNWTYVSFQDSNILEFSISKHSTNGFDAVACKVEYKLSSFWHDNLQFLHKFFVNGKVGYVEITGLL